MDVQEREQTSSKFCGVFSLMLLAILVFYLVRVVSHPQWPPTDIVYYCSMSLVTGLGTWQWFQNAVDGQRQQAHHVYWIEVLLFMTSFMYCWIWILVSFFHGIQGLFYSFAHASLLAFVCGPHVYVMTQRKHLPKTGHGRLQHGLALLSMMIIFGTGFATNKDYYAGLFKRLGPVMYVAVFCHSFLMIILWRNFMESVVSGDCCSRRTVNAENMHRHLLASGVQTDLQTVNKALLVQADEEPLDLSKFQLEETFFIACGLFLCCLHLITFTEDAHATNTEFWVHIFLIVSSCVMTFITVLLICLQGCETNFKIYHPAVIPGFFAIVRGILIFLDIMSNNTPTQVDTRVLSLVTEICITLFTVAQLLVIVNSNVGEIAKSLSDGHKKCVGWILVAGLAFSCGLCGRDMVMEFAEIIRALESKESNEFSNPFVVGEFLIYFLDLEFRFAIIDVYADILLRTFSHSGDADEDEEKNDPK